MVGDVKMLLTEKIKVYGHTCMKEAQEIRRFTR